MWKAVCFFYGINVDNVTTIFADGKVSYLLVNYYYPTIRYRMDTGPCLQTSRTEVMRDSFLTRGLTSRHSSIPNIRTDLLIRHSYLIRSWLLSKIQRLLSNSPLGSPLRPNRMWRKFCYSAVVELRSVKLESSIILEDKPLRLLKRKGLKLCLWMNPNIASVKTNMDDKSSNKADRIYFLPVTLDFVKEVIKKENPDGVECSMGGQTALNCAVEMYKKELFQDHNVKILGTQLIT